MLIHYIVIVFWKLSGIFVSPCIINLDQWTIYKLNICYAERRILVDGKLLMSSNIPEVIGDTIDSQIDFSNHVSSICKTETVRLKVLYNLCTMFSEFYKLDIVSSTIFLAILWSSIFTCGLTQENRTIFSWLQNKEIHW